MHADPDLRSEPVLVPVFGQAPLDLCCAVNRGSRIGEGHEEPVAHHALNPSASYSYCVSCMRLGPPMRATMAANKGAVIGMPVGHRPWGRSSWWPWPGVADAARARLSLAG